MSVTYTPGPWEANTLNGRLPIVREVRMPHGEASTFKTTVRSVSGESVCVVDFGYGRDSDEANARLIAAAPDLLAALKGLIDPTGRWVYGTPQLIAAAVAAIAKAEQA